MDKDVMIEEGSVDIIRSSKKSLRARESMIKNILNSGSDNHPDDNQLWAKQ